ncbi:MAG TPA: RNA-binding protein [Clostridiales bacterium UBA8960]|jgi:ribosomal 50S subunit-recycling heat shock protein|nr:RNA-binding protein [Clostridiales bacterium UBA8960]
MRIDKYLKNARLIKRRTIAKEACDQGRILVDGKIAKPGTEVKVGDAVEIKFGDKSTSIRILALDDHVSKDGAKLLYEVLSESK